jgi:PAS domain-containing protein
MPREPRVEKHPSAFDIEAATTRSRLKIELKELALAKAGGVAVVCCFDPSDRLERLLRSTKNASRVLDLSLANKVHALVLRVVTKPAVSKGVTLKLDVKAVEASSRVLKAATRALVSSSRSHGGNARAPIGSFVKRCTSTLCRSCEICESPVAWKYALEYVRDATAGTDLPFEEFFSEEHLGPNYQQIEAGYITALTWFLQAGDMVALTELAGLFRHHEALQAKAEGHLTQLLSQRASTLPSPAQNWIMTQMGLPRSHRDFEYANPADSPEIREAAALLLYLFDQKTLSAEMQEAFERFRGLCEAHFHLFLRGNIGEVTQFNSRLVERFDSQVGELRLIRPWVEWFLPPDARVVIRGIAESTRREAEVK